MIGQPYTAVYTADDAIGELNEESFDIVSLDHDLCGGVFEPSDEKSGAKVAHFIVAMDNPPKKVVLHSYNETGVAEMARILDDAECEAVEALFDSDDYWEQFGVGNETHI